MKKRAVRVFLCLLLLFTLLPTTAAAVSGDYKGASGWAAPELDKASGYGLITDKIKNNMTANLTSI